MEESLLNVLNNISYYYTVSSKFIYILFVNAIVYEDFNFCMAIFCSILRMITY